MYVAAFLSESSPDVSIRKHSCRLLSASSDRACARQTRPRPHAHNRDPSARHAFLIDNSMLVCYTASQVMSWHDANAYLHAQQYNREVSNGSAVECANFTTDGAPNA